MKSRPTTTRGRTNTISRAVAFRAVRAPTATQRSHKLEKCKKEYEAGVVIGAGEAVE